MTAYLISHVDGLTFFYKVTTSCPCPIVPAESVDHPDLVISLNSGRPLRPARMSILWPLLVTAVVFDFAYICRHYSELYLFTITCTCTKQLETTCNDTDVDTNEIMFYKTCYLNKYMFLELCIHLPKQQTCSWHRPTLSRASRPWTYFRLLFLFVALASFAKLFTTEANLSSIRAG